MKKSVAILLAFFTFISMDSFSQEESTEYSINWMTFEEALEASELEPKLWFIDMYTDWCGWCKRMDATTFADKHIIESINENYYAVKFDAEQKEDVIVGDSTYSFNASIGRRGCHELAVQLMSGSMSYPTYVFLNDSKRVMTKVPGYKVSSDMLPILDYMAQWTPASTIDFQTYLQSYESPYDVVEDEDDENEE